MNNKILITSLVVILTTISVKSQTLSSVTSMASATIVQPLILQEESKLNFGTISSTTSGTVIISHEDGLRTINGGVIGLNGGPTPSKGYFKVFGTNNCTYSVETSNEITLENGSGGTMLVNDFKIKFENNGSNNVNNGVLSQDGVDYISVGAKLNVENSQPSGLYTGVYNISVDYN